MAMPQYGRAFFDPQLHLSLVFVRPRRYTTGMNRYGAITIMASAALLVGCSTPGGTDVRGHAVKQYLAAREEPPAQRDARLAATGRRLRAPNRNRPGPSSSAASDEWLAWGDALASVEMQPATPAERPRTRPAPRASGDPADGGGFWDPVWRSRPARPNSFIKTVGYDAKELPATLWSDTKATVTNPVSLGFLAAAGVTGIVLSGDGGNDCVEEHFTKNGSQLNTEWDSVGGFFGSPAFHFPLAGALYTTGFFAEDHKLYRKSKTLINALALNGLTTMALKVAARTESPNGNEFGWPSGHTSSSFTLATWAYNEYGPWLGVPLYGFAAFVGYERIDARNHDFSDVISGALIGIAIGHAVCENHERKFLGMQLVPWTDPARGGAGLALYGEW